MEARLLSEQIKAMREGERREADVVFREHLARERIKKLETESFLRLQAEREKAEVERMKREAALGSQFRKAKYKIEKDVKAQEAVVKEK